MANQLSNAQRKKILTCLENDPKIFDFEGLPLRVQQQLPAIKDFENIEHVVNRYIMDYVSIRNTQKSFW